MLRGLRVLRVVRRGALDLRRTALPMVVAAILLGGTCVALSSAPAAAATSAGRTLALSANGQWPGVGKICEPGPGGASSVRGVGGKTINIAVFNDAASSIQDSKWSSSNSPRPSRRGATLRGGSTGVTS